MEQQILGLMVGAGSLALGYLLGKLGDIRAEEVSYLQGVPQFREFGKLREHLKNSPGQRADVMVEGKAEKLGNAALSSEKAGVEGAARVIATTTYSKLWHEETRKWRDISNTIENVNLSLPFKLVDNQSSHVRVESVHSAGGFRQVLQRVFQEKTLPEQRSMGDYATSVALKEIPNGSLTREFMLVFGTPIAGYGCAVLSQSSFFSGGEVTFTPVEVSSSISSLISRNEAIVKTFKFLSFMLMVGGGTVLVLSAIPLLVGLVSRGNRSRQGGAITHDESDRE